MLRDHRHAARLTLEQLAEVSGVSARALSDMERGRSRGPQHRTVTALADALVLQGDARKQLIELARDGRLWDYWTRPAGLCELPRLVDDFTGRAAELVWMSELVYAESSPGVGVAGLITGPAGLGKTTLAVRSAHSLRPSFPDRVFFLDLFGMSQQVAAACRLCVCEDTFGDPVQSLITGLPLDLRLRAKGQLAIDILTETLTEGIWLDFVCCWPPPRRCIAC